MPIRLFSENVPPITSGAFPTVANDVGIVSPTFQPSSAITSSKTTILPSSRPWIASEDSSSDATSSIVAGSTAVTNAVDPSTRNPPWRNWETAATPSTSRTRSATSGLNGVCDDVVRTRSAFSAFSIVRFERRLERRGEHRHHRDESQPDHERRSRRGRPARVPHRVLTPELALDAQAADRRADHGRERAAAERQQDRDPDERRGGSEPDQGAGVRLVAEQPVQERRDGRRGQDEADDQSASQRSAGAVRRLAERLDRRDARGAARGEDRRHDRDDRAHHERDDDRCAARAGATVLGRSTPNADSSPLQAEGDRDPGEEAERRCDQAGQRTPRPPPTS